jgi:hypothetical protein
MFSERERLSAFCAMCVATASNATSANGLAILSRSHIEIRLIVIRQCLATAAVIFGDLIGKLDVLRVTNAISRRIDATLLLHVFRDERVKFHFRGGDTHGSTTGCI